MAHLIDKDALVAEIDRLIEDAFRNDKFYVTTDQLNLLKHRINTLEVKEVDDETKCNIFPRPAKCYSTCKECPWLATNNKSQKGE